LDSIVSNSRPGHIYYIIPDICKRQLDLVGLIKATLKGRGLQHIQQQWFPKPKPIGGIKVILQHCLLLQELGFRATPIRLGTYEGNFFGYPISTKHISEINTNLSDTDIVVCPEICPKAASRFQGGQKAMFVQNWVHLYHNNAFEGEKVWGPYTQNGFDLVMCCSEYLAQMLNGEPAEKVAVVNNFIDLKSFARDDSKRIPGRVLALPRKNHQDLLQIMEILKNDNIDFRLVDGLSQSELIEEYQSADVFLATGYPEGFGLPPLEAMACGAAVVGFTGGGAGAFMVDGETALVAVDGDCAGAAEKLRLMLKNPELKSRLRAAGIAAANQYSEVQTKADLAQALEKLFPTNTVK
jgi:hypothetical protein